MCVCHNWKVGESQTWVGTTLGGFLSTKPQGQLIHELQIGCAVIFASKRNEAKRKRKFFCFDAKKVFFRLFSHLKRNENEIKRKQNEKFFEAKQSENALC
jgi:hypothetical protein